MAKQGFKGQWVAVAPVRRLRDSKGIVRDLTTDFMAKVIANYNANAAGEAPAVIGHPDENAPAYGWVTELRLNGEMLEAKFADTDDNFEAAVEAGRYKKRSGSFFLDPPMLRHVGFFGAQPVAAKGMPDIKFAQFADGEFFTVEETFNLQENEMNGLNDADVEKVSESVFARISKYFGGGANANSAAAQPPAAFSEADAKAAFSEMLNAAKTELTAEFQEKLDAKDVVIGDLSKRVDGQVTGSRKAEVASFLETKVGPWKHYLRNIGTAEFLESCSDDAIVSFSEVDGDTTKEVKKSQYQFMTDFLSELPKFPVEFGEKYADLVAGPEADVMVRPEVSKTLEKTFGSNDGDGGAE